MIKTRCFLGLLPLCLLGCKSTMPVSGAKAMKVEVANPYNMKYVFYKHTPGPTANINEVAVFDLMLYSPTDSLIFSSFNKGKPVAIPVQLHKFNGDFMDGLRLLSSGDSAAFYVSSDSMIKLNNVEPFITPGTFVKYVVKLYHIYSPSEYASQQMKEEQAQSKADSAKIENYIQQNHLEAQRTPSGLYYVIEQSGSGPKAQPGQTVSVHYTGMLLSGQIFDSSIKRGQPISFTLGRGQVIKGWDEGIALLSKGAKAKLIIPSSLAYGSHAQGPIPANSVLVFDVQLVDIQ